MNNHTQPSSGKPETSVAITFVAGARSVTGANFLVEVKSSKKTTRVLIDVGLQQGERFCESSNSTPFPYSAGDIDAVFFTHAHADHIGLFPKLVKEGFQGKAYATPPTAALMPVMLADSVSIITREAHHCGAEAPYTREDVDRALTLVHPLAYKEKVTVADGLSVTLYNAGHILGSAMALVEAGGTRLLFTGDLGRTPAILLPDPEVPPGTIDYLITESVYGNRQHENTEVSEGALLKSIQRTVGQQGTLLIPSFSLERTQIILAALDRFIAEKSIDPLPVFLDSPLATKVTDIYRQHSAYMRSDLKAQFARGDDPFSFPRLHVTYTREDAKEIDETQGAKVIIAGAGMSHGGRIRSHEKTYLPYPNGSLLLVGYQVPGSLGRRLQDGNKTVIIDKKKVKVRAKISKTGGFSAHADRDDLLKFAEKVNPKEVFVVLGDMEASAFLAQRISGFLGIKTTVPQKGEKVELQLKP